MEIYALTNKTGKAIIIAANSELAAKDIAVLARFARVANNLSVKNITADYAETHDLTKIKAGVLSRE